MTKVQQSLLWAGVIIVVALACAANGLSDGASFGVITGLSGAAWASIYSNRANPEGECGKGCLQ